MARDKNSRPGHAFAGADAAAFARKAMLWWLPLLYLLVSSAFYVHTYDSAQVKLTLVQMGGICLLALWLCCLLDEGVKPFSRDDLACLAPFLAYLAYGVFSFLRAPYHWSSADFFIRRVIYMTVAMIVIREFDDAAVARLVRVLVWTTWIAVSYGVLQWFDHRFFPPGIGQGIDPFIWRGAFEDRVFSTYGNPNFFGDFLVIMIPILGFQFMKTKRPGLAVLLALDALNLYWTQTKGAWIGAAISAILMVGTYLFFFRQDVLTRYKWRIAASMAAVFVLAITGVAVKLRSSFTSVNFRIFTWEATWEMIMTHPLAGTGIGSFWTIYPAFRRPPIFHIEGRHSSETDHAEDEYLEVLFDEGILGFGIFLWLLISTFAVGYRALDQMTSGLKTGERAPPRALELMGFLVALQGMMAHNFFDVSLRFVSSGVYFGLLPGLVVNLSRGIALGELHRRASLQPEPSGAASKGGAIARFLIWPARLAAWGGLIYLARLVTGLPRLADVLSGFDELQSLFFRTSIGGETLHWTIAWACLLGCVLGLGWCFLRIAWLTRKPVVCAAVLVMLYPLNLVWGFFRADVYHNLGILYSRQKIWEPALKYYSLAGGLNPAYVMSFYFKGNVFLDRFSMAKTYDPRWGDKNGVPRDDFERATEDYEAVRSQAPNYVQMHFNVGLLNMKLADWLMGQNRKDEAAAAYAEALRRFDMYRRLDPVFPATYFWTARVYSVLQRHDKAAETMAAYIRADECRVEPGLLRRDGLRSTLLSYQPYVLENGEWVHRHESPEAYWSLGNACFMNGDLARAEKAYKDALRLDPGNQYALRNLRALYERARQAGVLRAVRPPVAAPLGGQPPVPAFEVVPSRR